MTKQDAVKALGLEERGEVDYALPQPWVDEVTRMTGYTQIAAHFVYFYPKTAPGMGYPYPITDQGVFYLNLLSKV